MSMGTIYLLLAAALIFAAGVFVAKKIFPHLKARQMLLIAPIALAVVMLIWMFLALSTRKREQTDLVPPDSTQPTPLLRPDQD